MGLESPRDGAKAQEGMSVAAVRPLDDTRISRRDSGAATSAFPVSDRWERQAREIRSRKDSFFPSHVRACANNPDHDRRWTLALWPKRDSGNVTLVPYTCGSWRCPSAECQRAAAHGDFKKIDEAVHLVLDSEKRPEGWVSIVLTIDSLGTLSDGIDADGKKWSDEQHAFRQLSRNSNRFLKRLQRWGERESWTPTGNRWIATVESQRNGWPHINLLIYSPGLADWLRANPSQIEGQPGALRGELRDIATGTSWGPVGYAEPARNVEALAGYITKTAGNFAKTVGEISKLTQIPVNARMKVRRIRAGKGFLKSLPKDANWTGIMLKRGHSMSGALTVDTLMSPENVKCPEAEQPAYLEGVRTALALELSRYKLEAAGEPVKVVSRPEDRAKTLHDANIVSVLIALQCVSNIGENENAKEKVYSPNFVNSAEKTPVRIGTASDRRAQGPRNAGRYPSDSRGTGPEPSGASAPSERGIRLHCESGARFRNLPGMPAEIQRPGKGLQLVRINSGPSYEGHNNKQLIDKGKKDDL